MSAATVGRTPFPRGTPSSRPLSDARTSGSSTFRPWHAARVLALLLPLAVPAFAADQSQAARGREIYQRWCTPCHGTGLGKPGTAAAAAHGIKPAVLEQRTNLNSKMIDTAVRDGINFMPRFRRTEISDADLAAIVAYLVRK